MSLAPLRIALLTYRGNPFCGGQGVYVRHLSRELVRLGHSVDVLSGQPYPDLDDGVALTPVPSLDLYREPDPFRMPRLGEYRDAVDALPRLLAVLAGRVAIAHHARIERQFLSAACRRLYGRPLAAPFICTLALERRSLILDGRETGDGDLRLGPTRARYGLPRYRAHNALTDALAAAELFLAQAAHASGTKPARLGSLLN